MLIHPAPTPDLSPPPRWIEPYLFIPYVEGGRDQRGCDCWGLVRLLFQERLGIDLAAHAVDPGNVRAVAQAFAAPFNKAEWRRCIDYAPRRFDVFLMWALPERRGRVIRYLGHCGVVVTPTLLLHTEAGVGPQLSALAHPFVAPRLHSRYRHATLA